MGKPSVKPEVAPCTKELHDRTINGTNKEIFQVADMYNNQEQVKNQNTGGKNSVDDDFDF